MKASEFRSYHVQMKVEYKSAIRRYVQVLKPTLRKDCLMLLYRTFEKFYCLVLLLSASALFNVSALFHVPPPVNVHLPNVPRSLLTFQYMLYNGFKNILDIS
jgi:hypothetical protein